MAPLWWLSLLVAFALIEVAGVLMGVVGIAIEIAYGADVGLVLITLGAIVFGAGSGVWAKVYKGRPDA